jgi:hypothetical protein
MKSAEQGLGVIPDVGVGVTIAVDVGVGVTEVVYWHDIAGINKPISNASEMRDMRILFIAIPPRQRRYLRFTSD